MCLLLLAVLAAAPRYYARPAVLDADGILAPWQTSPEGQAAWRARIAVETLRRYPWAAPPEAAMAAPHYVFSGAWRIAADGTISVPPIDSWANGDLGQRAAYVLLGLVDWYRYSGEATVLAHLAYTADYLIDHAQTPADHPWPGLLISVPTQGRAYFDADPRGFIQLDIAAEAGLGLYRAGQVLGEPRYIDAARRWAELLAARAELAGGAPWGRYANPGDVPWEDTLTGGVAFMLTLFDELIADGHGSPAMLAARDAGRRYLSELLDRWTERDSFARNYWDWNNIDQAENVTEFAARYLLDHPEVYPTGEADAARLLGLFLHRSCAAPESGGDVYSGAWAYPESTVCCGRSLWYGPLELAPVWARLSDPRAREIARRMFLLATYDAHETGVVEDGLDGGPVVAGDWFKIAHPMALRHCLQMIEAMPDRFGAVGENHLVRAGSTVTRVEYAPGHVSYQAVPRAAPCLDVLRLRFQPLAILADGAPLPRERWRAEPIEGGTDWLVTIDRAGAASVELRGTDDARALAAEPGRAMTFTGRGVQLRGGVGPDGGLAEVVLDGRPRVGLLDTYAPVVRDGQTLLTIGGLEPGEHTLEVRPLGRGNPRSAGAAVRLGELVTWDAAGDRLEGRGLLPPRLPQRLVFGYAGRAPLTAGGAEYQPALEWIVRSGAGSDTVERSWWRAPRLHAVAGTDAPAVYRYGAHARELTIHLTVSTGLHDLRLKFCETRRLAPAQRALTIVLQGEEVVRDLDLVATGGFGAAIDLQFRDVPARAGTITIALKGSRGGEAMVQALVLDADQDQPAATPVSLAEPVPPQGNLLTNPGFESGVTGSLGRLGARADSVGWTHLHLGSAQTYLWAESEYVRHPEWGLPNVRTGAQALRTHADRDAHTVCFQEVEARPDTAYRASVWALPVDLRGTGFGRAPGDVAALSIQELDTAGRVLVEHLRAEVTTAGAWTELAREFTTGAATARIRFVLEARCAAPYDQGHVTWDDAELITVAPAAPAPRADWRSPARRRARDRTAPRAPLLGWRSSSAPGR